jgi:tetratricopeptide (TPR) repeat protein
MKRYVLTMAVLALGVAACAPQQAAGVAETRDPSCDEADALFAARKFKEAIPKYHLCVNAHHSSSRIRNRALANRGKSYAETDRPFDAVTDYVSSFKISIGAAFAAGNRPGYKLPREEWAKDIPYFQELARVYSHSPTLRAIVGVYHELAGQPDQAIVRYSQALDLRPDYFDVLYLRAYAYYEKEDYGHARLDLMRALTYRRDDAQTYYLLGHAYKKLGKPEEGQADIDRAAALEASLK